MFWPPRGAKFAQIGPKLRFLTIFLSFLHSNDFFDFCFARAKLINRVVIRVSVSQSVCHTFDIRKVPKISWKVHKSKRRTSNACLLESHANWPRCYKNIIDGRWWKFSDLDVIKTSSMEDDENVSSMMMMICGGWLEMILILKINFLTTGARLIKLIEMIINWLFQLGEIGNKALRPHALVN